MNEVAEVLDSYLRALEAGNAPNREALLARHAGIADELAVALDGLDFVHRAGRDLAGAPGSHEDAAPGKALGDYRLLREVGRGGMAVVYEAEQVSLGRHVALKVLPFAAVLDPKRIQRFKNEVLAAAHLRHPNIVPVYAVGCERGVHYYAMQYVEGESLAVAIRELKGGGTGDGGKTPISSHSSNREPAYLRMAAALGLQAAEALDHAHQMGIVHRDVKPGNLLVDAAGTLWLTDFGLAHSLNDVGLTITGELLGTIRYMSPEQALGKRVPVDHRTDIYSLGATLYELFTLEPAFPGDDPHLVIQDIALREPVLPRRFNPALPRDLETVVLKALEKDPSSRYATAQEMADDLKRYLEDVPVHARRPSLPARAVKWSRRHRTLVGATVVVLVLSTAGLATGTALLWREQAQTKAAFENARANLDLALQALDQIYIDEAEGQPKIREGLPKDLLQKGLGFYEKFVRENAGNPGLAFLTGNAWQSAGLIYRALGEEERALESFKGALAAYERGLELDPGQPGFHNGRGNALGDLGRFEESLAAYDRALGIAPEHAVVHTNRGSALRSLGRLDEALAACDRAIVLDALYTSAHIARGTVLRALGRFEESLAACDRAMQLEPLDALPHNNRGNALRDLRRFEEALAEFDRAIELNPRVALAHTNRGHALHDLGRFEKAIVACDRAIELNPRDASPYDCRGTALRDLGRLDESLAAYDRALEVDPRYADAHNNRGALLCDYLGRPAEALAEFDLAIELEPLHPDAHNNRSLALRALGRTAEALSEFDRAIVLGLRVAWAHTGRGDALCDLGRFEEALAAYDRAIATDPAYAKAHIRRGAALCDRLGRPGEALAEFDRAIELDPRSAVAHTNRGLALRGLRCVEQSIAACDRAIEIDPRFALAHAARGLALGDLRREEESLAAFDRAIAIDPRHAEAHRNRGSALRDLGLLEEALAAYDRAIEIDPQDALAHYNRANALLPAGQVDAALEAFREALRLRPNFAEAHCNLGLALVGRGQAREALPSLRKGHEIGSRRPDWRYPSRKWVDSAERQAELEDRLDRALTGEREPSDALERVEFALLLYGQSRYAESARMYAVAFAEDAALAEDPALLHRYNAACSAALAAAPGGADAAEWRGLALEWLRAELAAREHVPSGLVARLEHWKQDADLACVRDHLADGPADGREAWTTLWADVDALLARAREAK